jgi:beta-phosphoglucomutase-like phosphatase (HAD superfamily)
MVIGAVARWYAYRRIVEVSDGFRLGLGTGSNRDDVERALRAVRIHGCFDAFVFTEEVGWHCLALAWL